MSGNIYTLAVQAGYQPRGEKAAPATPPLVPSVGFVYSDMEQANQALGASGNDPDSYIYARYGGPTQVAFEQAVAALEGAEAALSFSSGMAALHAAILSCVPSGGRVVAAEQLYGSTRSLLAWLASSSGVKVRYADFLSIETVREAISDTTPQAVICEVLTNPLVRVVPINVIADLAHESKAVLIVDNTFATPFLLRPLEWGADLVVHSATKFLNGHGDVLGGVIAGSAEMIGVALDHRKLLGATPGAFEAWLALRGLRTLAVRMQQSCINADKVAHWLASQQRIEQIYYPGLPSDPSHSIARTLFREAYYGALLAFEIAGAGREEAFAFIERLRLIRPVTSLGDINSLIAHPATASHRSLTPDERQAQRITEGTLRLSLGIEDADDLIDDLEQALRTL